MIKYRLECKSCNENFDSWFSSSNEYEKLKTKDLLTCHFCNSLKVEKTLMAPSLNSKNNFREKSDFTNNNYIKKTIKNYQKFIRDNFKFVGENFAYEARSIHYDNKKKDKGIYGSASKKDIQELREEGIDTQIIPWLKDKEN
ncbi:MAG: hypothetical protein CNC05_00655 [Pelagibacterales bacterium MED-G42]|nr:MAG: hypothetical protein CNC05_00655 [Pelagibacterales bacterium MED-G42]|tara:strand:- start:10 stop:435 length:426 start_codon:yes stop_codon:yes gene_type:complete